MPIISVTQETKAGGVQSWPQQLSKDLSNLTILSQNTKRSGGVAQWLYAPGLNARYNKGCREINRLNLGNYNFKGGHEKQGTKEAWQRTKW